MKRNTFVFATLLAIVATAAALPQTALATPEKSVSAAPLEVTYYYLPT
jgi:hypothetical protein